jgi:hypothetical protein
VVFAVRDPSLEFYLRAPVVYTSDAALVRDVFAHDGPAFLVTSPAHYAEIDTALGERAHVWYATRRRRLYANLPCAVSEPNGSTNRAAPPSSSAIPRSRSIVDIAITSAERLCRADPVAQHDHPHLGEER